jgi:hypothetical protein
MSNLQVELSHYQKSRPTLMSSAGKFVLIKGEEVVGVYDSYEDALKFGYEKFGLDPFLVKRIAPAEQVSFFTRDLIACPA